jgi:hypothetical protein
MTAESPAAIRPLTTTARELPNLWPNHPALLLAMPLEVLHDEVRR